MRWYLRGGKRTIDILASICTLVLASPALLVIACCIWLDDRGPVLYRQRRIGRHGKPFELLKFRSMPVGTPTLTSTDARVIRPTRVGRLLRRTNVDELPQLINILRGEMSLVGPRPALLAQDDLIRLRQQNNALTCRPGLTGLAQVEAYTNMPVEEKATFDGQYASHITLWRDIIIVGRTVVYLFRPPPVY